MSKETKPKSEGCRWKVLWTLLLGFLLFGASNASAYNVTFIFNIPQADYSRVAILDDGAQPTGLTVPSDGVLEFSGSGGYFVGIPALSYTVTRDPMDNFQQADFGDALGDGLNYTRLEVKGDGTVTFQTPDYGVEPEPGGDNSITLNFTGETNAYQYVWIQNTTEYTADDGKWYEPTATSEVWNYEINKEGVASLMIASKPGYSIEVKCNTEGLVNQMETGDYYLSDMSESAGAFSMTEIDNPDSEFGGGWVLEIYNDKVSGASFTVTVKQVSQAINFTVVAGEGVESAYASEPLGGTYVSIINGVRNSSAPINGNKFTVQWEEGQTTQLILATNPNLEEAYEIVVTADVEPGSGTYTVSYGRNMLGNAQATINLFAGAVNHNFTVTVRQIAAEPDKEEDVTLDQGFTPEVGTKYMITPTEDGTLTINAVELSRAISDLSGALYSATGTVVSPSDYSAGASVNVMGIVSNFDYVKYNVRANNTYYFQLNTVGNNVELTATMKEDTGSEEPGPGEGDSDAVYIAFAKSSDQLVATALNPATDAQFVAQADGSLVYTYPLTEADSSIFSFLIYTAEGGKYTSIGVRDGTNSWGKAGVSIDLPAQGESIEVTFTDLGQFTVGSTYADDQASFTFSNAGNVFSNGTVTLTLSADLGTLEVNVEAPADEPEPEDGYVALLLDNAYTVNGAGSLKLVYTPEADGVLTATQTGSSDNHLFSQEPAVIDEATGQVSETYIIYSQDVVGNTLKYNVKANTTYYVYAALNGYDDITGVTFSFEESSSDDEYAIQIGETYTVNKNTPDYYYTATEDGTLLVQTNRADPEIAAVYGQWFIWDDAAHLGTPAGATVENANGGWLVKVPMTSGQTVYLYAETSTDIQVTFNWEEAASASTITAVEPLTAANYDYNTYPEVKIIGEGGVTSYGEVTFSYNDVVQVLQPEYVTTNGWPEFLQIKVATLGLTNLVETAALAGADSFTITVKDLKVNNTLVGINNTGEENVTVEDGTVTVTYPISKATVYLGGESTWPETFFSSWPAGDESGIATLVFDDEIASVGSVRVSMYPLVAGGDTGEATFNSYSITPTIDGETVTLDFTGREYVGSSSVVTVVVENAMGKNGMPVNFGEGVALYKQINFVNEPAPSDEPVEVESLDPAYGTAIDLAADGTFTFTVNFTGEAQINKILDGYGRQTGATVNPASGYAESFEITLPKSYLDQQLSGYVPGESEIIPAINLNIEATDKAGEEITYNDPNNVRVYYPFNFDIIYGVDFNVSVVAEAEGSLYNFSVSPADGFVSINAYEYTGDDAESFFDITITGPNDFVAHATEFADGVVTFNPAIEASGEYTINFPYHAFDITASEGSGSEDEGTSPDQDQVFNSMEKTYTFNVTITGADEPSGNTLLLENNNFFPKPNEKYTYTPTEDGVLTVKPMENGDFTTTTVLGGLYTSDGTFVQATETDGSDLGWAEGYSDMSYASFNLTAGQTYYWQWSKNADGDEYALYATFTEGSEEPAGNVIIFDSNTFYPQKGIAYYYTPKEDGVLKWSVVGGSTIVSGGLYTEDGQLITPTATDAVESFGALDVSWAEYNLTAGETYYFQWTKNDNEDDYALYVTWTAGAPEQQSTATININGVRYLAAVLNMNTEEPIELANSIEVEIDENGTPLMFAAKEGYKVTISCDEEGGEGIYQITSSMVMDEETGPQVMLVLYPGAIGYEFNVILSNIPEEGELPINQTFEATADSEYTYAPDVSGKLTITYDNVDEVAEVVGDTEAYNMFYVYENGAWTLVQPSNVIWNGDMFCGYIDYNIVAGKQYKFVPTVSSTFTTAFKESAAIEGEPVEFMLLYEGEALSTEDDFFTEVEPGFRYLTVFPDENIELGPGDEWNAATAFITIYNVNDLETSVGGVESFVNGQLKLWDPFEALGNFVINIPEATFIIDGNPSAAMSFYFTTGEDVVVPTQLYISGAFNDYISEEFTDEWELPETGEGTNIFTGTFEVPQGEFEFNLRTNEGMVYRFSGEGQAPETSADGEEERPGTMLFPIAFANNVYNGGMEMGLGGEDNYFWYNGTWNGGSITVTANLNNNTIKIEAKEDVEIDPNAPVRMYVLGGFDINNSVLTPNPSTDQELILNEKTGLYEGMVENWLGQTGTGINAKRNGKIFYTAVSGIYTFYGAQANSTGFRNLSFEYEGQTLDFDIESAEASHLLRAFAFPTSAANTSKDIYVQISLEDMQASFTWGYPEAEPEINALVFEDFEMELGKNPTTVEVPVSIQADEVFTYQGIQFTVTLPEGLTIEEGGIVLNDPLKGNATWNTSDDKYGEANTTSVVVLLTEPTDAVEDILTIKVTGKYGDIEEGTYPVTIQEVGFSNALGEDLETPEFESFTGYVTITEAPVPAESITIDSVTLNEPSFTDEENDMVEEVVAGESVDMTFTVLPEDTTDEATVTADNGATASKNEDGSWTIDTSEVVVPEGEESVTVTITITAGDVEETYELTVKAVLLGDSNANGVVTVADVVTTANYIAEKEIDNFCFPNANVILTPNDEGEQVINAQDLTATINIVLKIWDNERNPQNVRRQANRYASNDRLVADNFHAGYNNIGISLENTAQYAALQATIEIPAGMKVENVTVGQRAAGHELVYNVVDGKLNVVLFSYTNDSFANGEGSLFNISVTADENSDDLVMTNILASDAASNGYELASEGGIYSEATGIDGIDAENGNARYFTVDGIEVFNPEKGQILIRVEGDKAEKVLVK